MSSTNATTPSLAPNLLGDKSSLVLAGTLGAILGNIAKMLPGYLQGAIPILGAILVLYLSYHSFKGKAQIYAVVTAMVLIIVSSAISPPVMKYYYDQQARRVIDLAKSAIDTDSSQTAIELLNHKKYAKLYDQVHNHYRGLLLEVRARALWKTDQYEKSLADLSEALTLINSEDHEDIGRLYKLYGNVYNSLGRYNDAISAFSTAINKYGLNDPATRIDYALSLSRTSISVGPKVLDVLITVVKELDPPQNEVERNLLSNAYRRMASNSLSLSDKKLYMQKSYEIQSDDPSKQSIKAASYDDWYYYAVSENITKGIRTDSSIPTITAAIDVGNSILDKAPKDSDYFRTKLYRATRYAELILQYGTSYYAQELKSEGRNHLAVCKEILESAHESALELKSDYNVRLDYWNIVIKVNKLSNTLSSSMAIEARREAGGIVEYYTKIGQSNQIPSAYYLDEYYFSGAMSQLIKAYCYTYAIDNYDTDTLQRSAEALNKRGISGLPKAILPETDPTLAGSD